jgi:hypothetical protein
MFQPTLQRFLSRDPLSPDGVDVMTDIGFYSERLAAMSANPSFYGGNAEHPYKYANNNPLNVIDPSGLIGIFLGGTGEHAAQAPVETIPYLCSIYNVKKNGPRTFFVVPGLRSHVDPTPIIQRIAKTVQDQRALNPNCPIDIFGYSRGAIYAILLSQELARRGLSSIRYMGLIDPVSTNIVGVGVRALQQGVGATLDVPTIVRNGWALVKDPPNETVVGQIGVNLNTQPVAGIWVRGFPELKRRPLTTRHKEMGRFEKVRQVLMNTANLALWPGVEWGKEEQCEDKYP